MIQKPRGEDFCVLKDSRSASFGILERSRPTVHSTITRLLASKRVGSLFGGWVPRWEKTANIFSLLFLYLLLLC